VQEPRSARWSAAASPNLTRWGVRSWLLLGVLGFGAALLWLLAQVSGFVVPLALAAVMGAIFAPLVERLQSRGIPRSAGALLVLLGLTAVGVGSAWLVVTGILGQSGQIRAQVSAGLDTLSSSLASRGIDIGSGASATDQVGTATGQALGGVLGALATTFSGLMSLGIATAIGAFLLYYVLVDWAGLTRWVGAHIGLDAATGEEIVGESAVAVRRYFWALTLSAVVTAVLIGGTAWVLGVPLAFTIAVVTLVTSYVPYLGAILSGAFATLIALGANGLDTAIIMLVVILIVQNIVQTIVLVRLAGTALSLHPIVVLGATVVGAAVAGMLGAALASPAVAVAIMVQRRLSAGRGPVALPVELPPAVTDPFPDAQA
jgi:predicted PurR-regulated permease PerM